jgi:hypothetical protein
MPIPPSMNTNTNTSDWLSQIKVASPCRAPWDQMTGNDRARFCSYCQKNVYNLSALSRAEITALIQEKEGKLCARFYRRSDGTLLTADCPIGLRRLTRRLYGLKVAAAGMLLAAGTVLLITRNDPVPRSPGRLSRLWTEAVWTVKGWLGLQPVILGDVCVPVPSAQPTSQSKTSH